MVSKKAFMRTLEAVIAIAFTFIFITIFMQQYNIARPAAKNEDILSPLSKDIDFRTCLLSENLTCINYTLARNLEAYDYTFNLSKRTSHRQVNLPQKRIFSESIFVAGNNTLYEPRVLRIYYWEKG